MMRFALITAAFLLFATSTAFAGAQKAPIQCAVQKKALQKNAIQKCCKPVQKPCQKAGKPIQKPTQK
jgi:hypothetical protein